MVIVETGTVASIAQSTVRAATSVSSTLPAASLARTISLCEPSARSGKMSSSAHGSKPASSTSHSKVTGPPPGSEPANSNTASRVFESASGWSTIDVDGSVRSTVQVRVTGVASTLPAASVACTLSE